MFEVGYYEPMTIAARDVANWFLGRIDRPAGDSISNLKLQKLVYYAQAYYLAHHGKPLFDEELQAWTHGPVAPSVYREFKRYGYDSIPAPTGEAKFDAQIESFLTSILNVFGGYTGKALELMTHDETPWLETRKGLAPEASSEKSISKDIMRDFYRRVLTSE